MDIETLEKEVKQFIDEQMKNEASFTAWNVTKTLRDKGHDIKHNYVRQAVHDYMESQPTYGYVMKDFGNDKWAREYFLLTDDITDDDAISDDIEGDYDPFVDTTDNTDSVLEITDYRRVDQHHRLLIPTKYIRQLIGSTKNRYKKIAAIFSDKGLVLKRVSDITPNEVNNVVLYTQSVRGYVRIGMKSRDASNFLFSVCFDPNDKQIRVKGCKSTSKTR